MFSKQQIEVRACNEGYNAAKKQILEIIYSYSNDKQCKCDREVNYICDVCFALEEIIEQIEKLV